MQDSLPEVLATSATNPYAKENRIKQAASQLGLTVEVRKIDAKTDFPGHIFLTTHGAPTFPNFEVVIFKEE